MNRLKKEMIQIGSNPNPRKPSPKKQIGRRGGGPTGLFCRVSPPPSRGKDLRRRLVGERGEAEPPLLLGLARAPDKGAAASPLDGGTLTRVGSARADEGADNGAMLARSPLLLVALRAAARARERAREE